MDHNQMFMIHWRYADRAVRQGEHKDKGQDYENQLRELRAFVERKAGEGWTLNGGAIIDHEAPRERRFVAVEK